MKNLNTKLFAFLMAACMLLTLMPFAAFAEGASVTTEYELREAAAAGGEYTVDAMIDVVEGPITINKDLTLHLGADIQMLNFSSEQTFDVLFIVAGATLTVNGNHCICHNGPGYAVKLIGAETQTALISNGVSWQNYNMNKGGEQLSPDAVFSVEHAEGTLQPTIELNDSFCQAQSQSGSWTSPLVIGDDAKVTIKGGGYYEDVSEYIGEDYVCIPYYEQFLVLKPDKEFSDEFTLTGKDGVLTVNRYAPQSNSDMDLFLDYLYTYHGESVGGSYEFLRDTYDFENHTMYVFRIGEMGVRLETHLIRLEFVYDADIKTQVDTLIETLPEGSYDEEGWYIPYYYAVSDLELFNYWMTCNEDNDWFNINSLINYSTEFKEKIDYRNYRLDIRAGDGDYFYTLAEGIADFKYGNTVYAATHMGVRADHVLYVSDEVEDTPDAMLAAVQKRLDEYLGDGKITVEILSEEEQASIGFEGYGFRTVINDWTYYFLAERNSAKMVTPAYKSVDVSTEVAVLTEDSAIPLDTMVEVETMTEGDDYDRIMAALDVEEHETYNIKLYSDSKADYVTSLENGTFEVQIPVSEQLAGKELIAYYVDAEGTVAEHEVTVEEGVASFATDHFSAYTLAVKKSAAPCEHAFAWDEESKNYLCSACGAAYEQTLDIDGDGSPTTADAILLLRAIDGGIELPLYLTDINRDGKLRIFDAVRFLQLMNA